MPRRACKSIRYIHERPTHTINYQRLSKNHGRDFINDLLMCIFYSHSFTIQIFLLLRKNSPVYSHFSVYIADYKEKSPTKSVTVHSKLIATPKTPSTCKLSPLGYINKLLPGTSTPSRILPNQEKNSLSERIVDHVKAIAKLSSKTSTFGANEEEKKTNVKGLLKPPNATFQITTEKEEAQLISSPYLPQTAVRVSKDSDELSPQHFEEATKLISSDKSKKLVLCACGKPCEATSDTMYISRCTECKNNSKSTKHCGYLYEKENDVFKRFHFAIVGAYLHSIFNFLLIYQKNMRIEKQLLQKCIR